MKLWLFAIVLILSVMNSIDANTIRPLSLPECIQLDSPQQEVDQQQNQLVNDNPPRVLCLYPDGTYFYLNKQKKKSPDLLDVVGNSEFRRNNRRIRRPIIPFRIG